MPGSIIEQAPVGFIAPMLPTLAEVPPEGPQWRHEVKQDGYRTLIRTGPGGGTAWTRNGHDWTERYRTLVKAVGQLRCETALIDGEVIVQNERGVSDYASLRSAIARSPRRLVFVAFDLLHLDGRDLRRLPLASRRAALRELMDGVSAPLLLSDDFEGSGADLLAAADRMGLEGIVSKRLDSRYRSGRSRTWLKTKCFAIGEFDVLGVKQRRGGPSTAILATREDAGLRHVGEAFVALGGQAREAFWRAAEDLVSQRPMLEGLKKPEAIWLRSGLRVRVRHLRGEEPLRHATIVAVEQSSDDDREP